MEAFAAFTGRGRAGDAFEFSDRSLFAEFLHDVFRRHFAAFHVVGRDVGHDVAFVSGAVNGDDGDLRFVRGDDGVGDRCGVDRIDDENIDFGFDQVSDVVGLLGRVILRIDDLHIDLGVCRRFFSALRHGDEEGIILGGYGKADGDCLFAGRSGFFFLRRAAAGNGYEGRAEQARYY